MPCFSVREVDSTTLVVTAPCSCRQAQNRRSRSQLLTLGNDHSSTMSEDHALTTSAVSPVRITTRTLCKMTGKYARAVIFWRSLHRQPQPATADVCVVGGGISELVIS